MEQMYEIEEPIFEGDEDEEDEMPSRNHGVIQWKTADNLSIEKPPKSWQRSKISF